MMNYGISAEEFLERHEKNVKRAVFRLKMYLADPSEENVHDLRTATRRLVASYTVLPKLPRSGRRIKRFVATYKKIFKASGKARDMDVMMIRLRRFESEPAVRAVLDHMEHIRRDCLERVEETAVSLERLTVPAIQAKKIPQAKLQSRFNRLIRPLLSSIDSLLPVVVEDRRRIEELHRLRIACKKLRYLLEIIENESSVDMLESLRQIQGLLGDIHDSDVMIEFLRGMEQRRELARPITSEARRRQRIYRKFVSFAGEISGQDGSRSFTDGC